jgi:hypothetical protein
MKYFIDNVINLMFQYTENSENSEMKEQSATNTAAPTSTGSGGQGYPNVPKWSEVVGGPKRGKANMLGAEGETWSTGINRGVANQLW